MLHTKFEKNWTSSYQEEVKNVQLLTHIARRTTHDAQRTTTDENQFQLVLIVTETVTDVPQTFPHSASDVILF